MDSILPTLKNVPEDYVGKYTESKRLFSMYHDTLDMQQLTIHHSQRKLDELFTYLTQTCSMSEKRVQNGIKKINQSFK